MKSYQEALKGLKACCWLVKKVFIFYGWDERRLCGRAWPAQQAEWECHEDRDNQVTSVVVLGGHNIVQTPPLPLTSHIVILSSSHSMAPPHHIMIQTWDLRSKVSHSYARSDLVSLSGFPHYTRGVSSLERSQGLLLLRYLTQTFSNSKYSGRIRGFPACLSPCLSWQSSKAWETERVFISPLTHDGHLADITDTLETSACTDTHSGRKGKLARK